MSCLILREGYQTLVKIKGRWGTVAKNYSELQKGYFIVLSA
ncbi:hypothetical protein Psal011_03652 (plasmid) [Piscirickettsia salmonis]|nr:hypothetical protein Psal011_03652 [Piscirickettsia salmonis]